MATINIDPSTYGLTMKNTVGDKTASKTFNNLPYLAVLKTDGYDYEEDFVGQVLQFGSAYNQLLVTNTPIKIDYTLAEKGTVNYE